jgi:hypothetical protein
MSDAYKELVKQNSNSIHPILDSPQQRFVASTIREVGYGGEAGGAKSYGLILCPLYQLHKDDYHAILFRRTYKQLSGDDGLIDLSKKVYPHIGGRYIKSEYRWEFSGYPGTIRFAHIEHENVLEQDYEGHQYAFVAFDELQTFSERMYLYMFSRNRCTNPDVNLYTRSTFMPGGIGHHFVKKRFIVPFKDNGDPKYFTRIDGTDTEVGPDNTNGIRRVFIPAKLEDNPYLWNDGNSDYERGLRQLDTVDYKRKKGDWDIRRAGRVYHAFNDDCIGPDANDLDYSKAVGYWHSHDFGAVNRVWGLYVKIEGTYYKMFEEILPEGTSTARAARIKSHFEGRKVVAGWGGASSERQQRTDYSEAGVIIRSLFVKDVESQIDNTNKMFEDGTLKICSNCTLTIDQLENCVRDDKEQIADKSKWHFLDETRYLATGVRRQGWVR